MTDSSRGYQQFFAEMKRRRVFRVMAVYGIVGFVVLQIVDLAVPALLLPEWTYRFVALILLLGFPVAIVLAWAFEMTPEGVQKTQAAAPGELGAIIAAPASQRWPAGLLALVGVVALVLGAWWVGRWAAPGTDAAVDGDPVRSLAVLPLDNLTGDDAQAYFVDGMHEALISELARIEGLTVLSRTSTLRYRNTDLSLGEIAAELGTEGLVEGSVFKAGDTVRITVQLIRGSPEEHLWTDSYLGELSNALSLHRRVARSIAEAIRLTLSPEAEARLSEEHGVNARAQDAYLQGRALWRTRQRDNLQRAVTLMQEAVALDPDFALGHAGLADAYLMHASYGGVPRDSLRQAWSRTREAALRALQLDSELAEPHAALGLAAMHSDLDWTEAESRIRRSLELNPNYSQGWDWLADVLSAQGKVSEAIEAMQMAVELDPFSPLMHRGLGLAVYKDRRCEDAVGHLRRALELDPEHSAAHFFLYGCSLQEGDESGALEHLLRSGIPSEQEQALREAYQSSGWEGVDSVRLDRTLSSIARAAILTRQGRHAEAVEALRAGYEDRRPRVILSVGAYPPFDPLRDREDFQSLLADMGLGP